MASSGRRAAAPIVSLIVGNVLFATGLIFHAFLYNFYLEALHLSPVVMGHAAAALTGGGLAMLLPAGALTDRAGPRTAVMLAAVVLAAGLVLGALAASPPAIYGAAAVAGAGSGLWRVATPPVLMGLTVVETRPRAFAWNVGLLVGWSGLGTALAGGTSQWLESGWGLERLPALRVALILGAAGSGLSVLLFRALRAPESGAGAAPVRAVERTGPTPAALRTLLPLVALVAIWMLGAALAAQFFNIYFAREHGLGVGRVGVVLGAANLVWAVAVVGSGEVASRFGVQRLLIVSLLLFAPAMWGLSFAHTFALAATFFFLQGLIAPVTNPLIDQWLLGRTPPERQGAVSSWRQVAADASAMAGASFGGRLLAGGGFGPLFAVAAGVGLVGAVGLIAGLRFGRDR
jgi:MFS family permease